MDYKAFFLVPFYRKLAVITVLISRTGMVLGDLAPITMYLLWLNIIPGLNCTSLRSKLITMPYYTPKQREIKLKPGIKLNHNVYIRLHEFRC